MIIAEAIWRAGLLGLRPFGSDPKLSSVLDLRRRHRHGAELARFRANCSCQFGTKAQQDYWLPRLARGEEIPCFGLTPAGSGPRTPPR